VLPKLKLERHTQISLDLLELFLNLGKIGQIDKRNEADASFSPWPGWRHPASASPF
jgi:hypothetical protein